MQQALALAERIVRLRADLAAAEGEFQKLVGVTKPRRPTTVKPAVPTLGLVAPRVRALLQDGQPRSFGDIREAMGDVKPEAIKSALKKSRDSGQVGFRSFKYFWIQ